MNHDSYFTRKERELFMDSIAQSDRYVEAKIQEITHRPRKCLNRKTPYKVYHSVELRLI